MQQIPQQCSVRVQCSIRVQCSHHAKIVTTRNRGRPHTGCFEFNGKTKRLPATQLHTPTSLISSSPTRSQTQAPSIQSLPSHSRSSRCLPAPLAPLPAPPHLRPPSPRPACPSRNLGCRCTCGHPRAAPLPPRLPFPPRPLASPQTPCVSSARSPARARAAPRTRTWRTQGSASTCGAPARVRATLCVLCCAVRA